MAILALQQYAWLASSSCFRGVIGGQNIDRQNDDGTGMPDNITAGAHAPRFLHFVGGDAEHRAPVTDSGREHAG